MTDDKFRDWIPDGEDTGAIGDGGFQDFVPEPQPKPQNVTETKVEPVVAPQPKQDVAEDETISTESIVPPLDGGGK